MSSRGKFTDLHKLAETSLTANIVDGDLGPYLAAGAHQFGSLWTRDFCFSVRGLLAIDRADVVRNHLTHLLASRRRDGVIARVLESVPSWRRVVLHTAFRFLPTRFKTFSMTGPLRAEYIGEHGTISIDSNALVIRAALDLHRHHLKTKKNVEWLESVHIPLQECLDFMLARCESGNALVSQGRFEDWQDSSTRSGETFYTNLLFAVAFRDARELGLSLPESADGFERHLKPVFFEPSSGLYRTHRDLDAISLDGNVLLIAENILPEPEARELWMKLKSHPIWTQAQIPGVATYPDYPSRWISWTTKLVGLRHYHDRLLWLWLSGFSAKAALQMGDRVEAERIFSKLTELARRDQAVGEVYNPHKDDLPLFETVLYRSEAPFSWAAGVILEALLDT